MEDGSEIVARALVEHERTLEAFVTRRAGALLRYETEEDLAQGARLRALERSASFEWTHEPAFIAWLKAVVSSYLNDRRAYWNAARRNAGHVLRVSLGRATESGAGGIDPRSLRTGPLTFADRRDQLDLAVQVLSTLLPRDQRILELERKGHDLPSIADDLDLTPESAARARLRAHERFQRAFELMLRAGGSTES